MKNTKNLFEKYTKLPLDLIKIILKYIKCSTCNDLPGLSPTPCIYCDQCYNTKIFCNKCFCVYYDECFCQRCSSPFCNSICICNKCSHIFF